MARSVSLVHMCSTNGKSRRLRIIYWMTCLFWMMGASPGFTTVLNETTKVQAFDPDPGVRFGNAVAIDDTTAVVGSHFDNDNGINSGSAYVFDLGAGGNSAVKILPSDGAAGDFFGSSVAVDGNTVLVGAWRKSDNGIDAGAAYLFNATTGAQIARLLPTDNNADDQFGYSVALRGNLALVGARADDFLGIFGTMGHNAGSAYLFDATTGTQIAKFVASDGDTFDSYNFGEAVALDGDIVIIGSAADSLGGGAAYLFNVATPATPLELVKLQPADGSFSLGLGVGFGGAVSISGNIAVVGAFGDDTNLNNAGSAYVFDVTTYAQLAKLFPDDPEMDDSFGAAVGITETTIIVGSAQDDDYGISSGSAYVFESDDDGNTWTQDFKLLASDGAAGDQFGTSVAIRDDTAVVGSILDDDTVSGSGSAYLFENPVPPAVPTLGPRWMQIGLAALLLYFGVTMIGIRRQRAAPS